MEYIYACLMLHKLGKAINEANVRKVIESTGSAVNESRLKSAVVALEGVNIDEVIKEAKITPTASTEKKEVAEKKVEKKEEKKEAAAGLGALFG